ncbi:MAG: PorP/SprF family type IX secretion system membrane protein [Crocinitomicaceae bacterium]|jgi:type IX secretion system PorP/SprF family membrane protein|nr:PorP/SprF family type IX secretion system membrane protein [Crocinitomicaceae bacterium]
MVRLGYAILLFATTTITYCYSQQDKVLTHFIYDKMSLNPGETGIDEGICGTSVYRNQWDKITGAPVSMIFNVEANINRWFPGGVGLSFYNDRIGFAKQNNLLLNYAYPVYTDYGTLGVGIGAGLFNYSLDPDWIPPTDVPDFSLPTGFAASSLDLNFGLYWKGLQNYYVGFSSTHLNAPRLSQEITFAGLAFAQTYNSARHYYLMGGYTYSVGPGDADGNFLLRTDGVKTSVDLNVRYLMPVSTFNAYGGLTFRTNDAIALMLGGSKNGFTVGYAYDITINKLAKVSRGSHEILLKYCYYLPPIPKTPSKHPRWL